MKGGGRGEADASTEVYISEDIICDTQEKERFVLRYSLSSNAYGVGIISQFLGGFIPPECSDTSEPPLNVPLFLRVRT